MQYRRSVIPRLHRLAACFPVAAVSGARQAGKTTLVRQCFDGYRYVSLDVGVSVKAVSDWISVLEASGQIALLEPWFTNIAKRVVKTPKLYFRDSGLLCFLLNLTGESLPGSPLIGPVWKTFVFAELRKLNYAIEQPVNLWYYRDQRAREVDFILEAGGRLSFLEAKRWGHPSPAEGT